jgi:hypothetical protein
VLKDTSLRLADMLSHQVRMAGAARLFALGMHALQQSFRRYSLMSFNCRRMWGSACMQCYAQDQPS